MYDEDWPHRATTTRALKTVSARRSRGFRRVRQRSQGSSCRLSLSVANAVEQKRCRGRSHVLPEFALLEWLESLGGSS